MANKNIDPTARYKARRGLAWRLANQLLKKKNKNAALDALLITNRQDIQYLSGVTEGSPCLLIGKNWSSAAIHKMYRDVAPPQAPGTDCTVIKSEGEWIDQTLKTYKAKRIGFEEHLLTFARHRQLTEKLPASRKLLPLPPVVIEVRAVKDAEEIRLTQKAVRIAEKAFTELTAKGAKYLIGKTEGLIAAELEYRMRELGAHRQAFGVNGIIVASGPNSASCHHMPTNRKIKAGEPLLIDWGAEVEDYRSDITRVIYPKQAPAWIHEIHNTVEKAMVDSTKAVKPRVNTSKLHKIAQQVIEDAGHGEYFPHSLGHGLGLVIHEYPRVTLNTPDKLKPNMLITIEPGIYYAGKGGVRLENDILVTDSGYKVMNKLPSSLEKSIVK